MMKCNAGGHSKDYHQLLKTLKAECVQATKTPSKTPNKPQHLGQFTVTPELTTGVNGSDIPT